MKHSAMTMTSALTARRLGLAAMLAAGVAMAPLSSAMANASITWGAVQNETGNISDVVTTGVFVDSATAGAAVTVNGVSFNSATSSSGTIGFAGSNITLSGIGSVENTYYSPAATTGWNANYQTLVNYGAVNFTGANTMTIGGLTLGQTYLVELFETPWDLNWQTSFGDGINSPVALNLYGGAVGNFPASSNPQYVTGTFTATGTSESIFLSSSAGVTIFDAAQVRNVTTNNGPNVPEPSDLAILAGAGVAFLALRRGKSGRSDKV